VSSQLRGENPGAFGEELIDLLHGDICELRDAPDSRGLSLIHRILPHEIQDDPMTDRS